MCYEERLVDFALLQYLIQVLNNKWAYEYEKQHESRYAGIAFWAALRIIFDSFSLLLFSHTSSHLTSSAYLMSSVFFLQLSSILRVMTLIQDLISLFCLDDYYSFRTGLTSVKLLTI